MFPTVLGLLGASLPSLVPSSAAPPAPTYPARPAPDVVLQWGREKLSPDELPESVPDGARETVGRWAPWAEELGYRMDLSADGRVLLLTIGDKKGAKDAKKNMKRIEEILEATDEILPIPASRAQGAGDEDENSYEWGQVELESQTAVLLEIDEPAHQDAAVDVIVEGDAYLGPWARAAKKMTGFVLERPLVGAWQPKAGIKEDWEGNPTNEMVNRLAQLLTLRRFGRQPYWLAMGIAWYTEMEQTDGIFCFPYRSGFVSASEHTKWDKLIENRYRRRDDALAMREVTQLKRGTWDTHGAQNAWGTVSFLVRYHPEALPEILDELHRIWDREGREEHDDGTWERIPDFEPDDETQLAVFEKHVPGFLEELTKCFAKGKKYKP